ncbi:MAG: hypothetical protein GIW99_08345 [Candidatus Eremiobacteraeota bacterium]|nr:hypothetical protein [Candidatus Eremiobacteraeota bacterium]MBC5827673.1 hypothetical protein [Candidatus Eremiobacteraeota bacterium]
MDCQQHDLDDLSQLVDLTAALGEHVSDLARRLESLESGHSPPKGIAASDLRGVAKGLMALSLMRRRRSRQGGP